MAEIPGGIIVTEENGELVENRLVFGQPPKHVLYAAYTDAHLMVIRSKAITRSGDYTLGKEFKMGDTGCRWSIQIVPNKPLGISPLTLSYTWTQFLEVLLGIAGPIKDNEGRVCVFVFGPKETLYDIHSYCEYCIPMGIHVIRITSIIYQ